MKRLKILFYLIICFLFLVFITKKYYINVNAENRLPGYSEWSLEQTGKEGEISLVLYGYKEALTFSSEETAIMPADGYYNSVSKYKITSWSSCACDWRDIYGPDSGISCWQEGAGVASYRCSYGPIYSYSETNSCSGVCSVSPVTLYYPVDSWSETQGLRTNDPYLKTNTISPIEVTVYSYPLTYSISFDDGQSISIKHGEAFPHVNVPSKEGYIFKGFFDNTGKQIYDSTGNSSLNFVEGMATNLVSNFEPITYNVNYLSSGGSGPTYSQSLKYDEYSNVQGCAYSKTGYIFSCWKDEFGKIFMPGETIYKLTSTNNGSYNLHAIWIVEETKETKEVKEEKEINEEIKNDDSLDSDNYYLIKVPKELTIDNDLETINLMIKGNLKDNSNLKIELPKTLLFKTNDESEYEVELNNVEILNSNEINSGFKEVDISLYHPFNDEDEFNISCPLIIEINN